MNKIQLSLTSEEMKLIEEALSCLAVAKPVLNEKLRDIHGIVFLKRINHEITEEISEKVAG